MPGRTAKPFTLNGRPQETPTPVYSSGVRVLSQDQGTATSFVPVEPALPLQALPPPYRNLSDGKR